MADTANRVDPKTPSQILKEARAKIEKPENWCQNKMGLRNGHVTRTDDPNFDKCECFCAVGAIAAASRCEAIDLIKSKAFARLRAFTSPDSTVTAWNDTHTHSEVLAAFDKAIELAEQEEKGAGTNG